MTPLLISAFFIAFAADKPAPSVGPDLPSEAERIIRLKRTLDADGKQLAEFEAALDDPKGEYAQAEAKFREADALVEAAAAEARRLKADGKPDEAAKKDAERQAMSGRWKAAKERFTLAIEDRKTRREKVTALKAKIARDKEALDRLVKGGPVSKPADAPPKPADAPKFDFPPTPATIALAAAAVPNAPAKAGSKDRELAQARERVQEKGLAVADAEEAVKAVVERVEQVKKQITLEKQTLQTVRHQADLAHKAETHHANKLTERRAANAPMDELDTIEQKRVDAADRFARMRADSRASNDRLIALQQELAALHEEQLIAERELRDRQREADQAQKAVAHLQNPYTLHNIAQWMLTHGLKLLLIVVGAVVLYRLVNLFSQRIVAVVAQAGQRGTEEDAENRAQTLVGVFRNTASCVVLIGGTLLFLEEAGIPIVPLLGGAAIAGLAVAFGAQNLIRDYFSGFMVLLEDQYGVKDVIKIGEVAGQVENITLRMTVLRDMEGVVHFIPHGTITHVSNMTHGWSRAFFEIGVSYSDDPDRVMEVLMDLARELRRDPKFGPLVLDGPEMLGIDSFGEPSVNIKFFVKTKPLHQWTVKRELLRRIKRRFDELGIEIPFPHRTVIHRHEGAAGPRLTSEEEAA